MLGRLELHILLRADATKASSPRALPTGNAREASSKTLDKASSFTWLQASAIIRYSQGSALRIEIIGYR